MWVPLLDFTFHFNKHMVLRDNCVVLIDQVSWIWYDLVSKGKGPLPACVRCGPGDSADAVRAPLMRHSVGGEAARCWTDDVPQAMPR